MYLNSNYIFHLKNMAQCTQPPSNDIVINNHDDDHNDNQDNDNENNKENNNANWYNICLYFEDKYWMNIETNEIIIFVIAPS